ncbi:MAG: Maf family nucleotide pyrophosphatase [Gammaproteobacteria bacterium]
MLPSQKIILASSSPYRKALLQRLKLDFLTASPAIDESRKVGETADKLALRLARAKAMKLAKTEQNALIIGSDQVARLGKRLLTKPGNRENAIRQLQMARGRTVTFITAVCVINSGTQACLAENVITRVTFRDFSDEEITRYLDHDTPYDCAGSFKSEQLGITLVQKLRGDDPTALIGLPLIKLAEMLRDQGLYLP